MSELIEAARDTRWGSTKFWLVVGLEVYTCVGLARGILSQDNWVFVVLSLAGAYLGVNLLQHKTYTAAVTTRTETAAVTRRALDASDAVTEQHEDILKVMQSKPPQQEQP